MSDNKEFVYIFRSRDQSLYGRPEHCTTISEYLEKIRRMQTEGWEVFKFYEVPGSKVEPVLTACSDFVNGTLSEEGLEKAVDEAKEEDFSGSMF